MRGIKVTSYKQRVLGEMERKVKMALDAIGAEAVNFAQSECPVDTGRLQNSIEFRVRKDAVYIGTNVKYAPYVEYNDHVSHPVGKAHFLRDAVSKHGDYYKAIAEAALKD